MVEENPSEIRIVIPQFMTHAPMSKTKFIKINGQRLYSGLNPHVRSAIVNRMHKYLEPYIEEVFGDLSLDDLLPLRIRLEVHVPINYGDVRMVKGELKWKVPKEGYEASWDVDNLWIWGKTFNDTLTQLGHLKDDSATFVQASGEVKHVKVDTFDDRKLIFIITKCN